MSQPRVFLAVPCYHGLESGAVASLIGASRRAHVTACVQPYSVLPTNFNRLWCDALNSRGEQGWTHFAMLHSDVEAEPGWLDTLIAEQQRVQADMVSAVIAIKDGRGLTSTVRIDR